MGTVTVDTQDHIMVITIDRPETRNAIDKSIAVSIAAAVDNLERSSLRLIGVTYLFALFPERGK